MSRRKLYASDAERQTARRVRRYARGLNSTGKPYARHPNFVNPGETTSIRDRQVQARRERKLSLNLARYRRMAQTNRALGLRTDGQPFRRHQQLHAWNNLRAEMKIGTLNIEDVETARTREAYQL